LYFIKIAGSFAPSNLDGITIYYGTYTIFILTLLVKLDHFTQKLIAMFKNLLKFAFLFMIGASMITMTSCGTDDPLPNPEPVKTPPTIEILTTGFYDTIFTADTSNLFTLNVKADTGSIALKSFAIYNEGVKMDVENFRINGNAPASNPISILDATEQNGFTWDVAIRSQNTYDTQTYTVEITDENGKTAEASVVIVVTEPVTTDLLFNGSDFKLFNNGTDNQGGIELLTGTPQSASLTSDEQPHIYDRGPVGGWDHKISPATTAMSPNYTIVLKSTTGVDYDAVNFVADIQTIFDAGTEIPQGEKSNEIQENDVFVAKVNDTYVLFRFDVINNGATHLDDYYSLSIKH